MDDTSAPLRGLRVLDLSRIVAGPLCAQQLADMGADVIKVENPVTGDEARNHPAPRVGSDSHFFLAFNRNKRSIGLDFREGEGRRVLLRLLERADVLVENFRPGVLARFGLDHASLRDRFPRLVYLSISAYGEQGSLADRPGFDPVMQAESGIMALTGEPGGPPLRSPLPLSDMLTALHATGAVMAALWARQSTGRGQHVELSLRDVAAAALGNAAQYYLLSGRMPPRSGNSHPVSAPVNLFETADGPLYLATGSDRLFRRLCVDILDRPELPDDPRFRTATDRSAHREELFTIIGAVLKRRTRAEWMVRLRHLPAGPVQSFEEAFGPGIVHERGMLREVEHPCGDTITMLASPIRFSDTPVCAVTAPPMLGQHSREILDELGYDAETIAMLARTGAVTIPEDPAA